MSKLCSRWLVLHSPLQHPVLLHPRSRGCRSLLIDEPCLCPSLCNSFSSSIGFCCPSRWRCTGWVQSLVAVGTSCACRNESLTPKNLQVRVPRHTKMRREVRWRWSHLPKVAYQDNGRAMDVRLKAALPFLWLSLCQHRISHHLLQSLGPHPHTVVKDLLRFLSHPFWLSDFFELALGACSHWLGFLPSFCKNPGCLQHAPLWLSCTLCLAACSTIRIWLSLWGKDLFRNYPSLFIIVVCISAVLCKL